MSDKMRTLATTALVAVALGAGAVTASAQGLGGGEWYVKGFGGATFPQDDSIGLPSGANVDTSYDTGYVLGAALGYGFTPNAAVELEYAYRSSDGDLEGGVGSDAESNAFMLNALYTFAGMGPNGAFAPYIGGGLGVADLSVDVDGLGEFSGDSLFAYQIIGGVGYEVAPNWTLVGEVRWFATESSDLDGPGNTEADASLETIDLLVGATYSF